jgi:glycosyltransferase involved in cell wall biosynthesis/2-polyprenyl-3-methyl-5-hydroxy-6-metoxy-1,4-benzoquinol methylase
MLNACTIIACNYLPFARVLADSFRAHHPDGRFTILLIDDEQGAFSPPAEPSIEWRRLADIGLERDEIRRLAGIYDVTELATAVKPVLLRRLLDEGRGEVIYLDPDIRIYETLDEIARLSAEHGIVLTPHSMQPYPNDERQIDNLFILAAGVYNLGFIGVGTKARPFLDWWWDRTRREALIDPSKMMFTDQRWVDFVPSFFEHHILKDPGYNVAYWNLHARDFKHEGGRYTVDGAPLRFFHFSGFDPRKPWLLSKHQGDRPRVLLSERPALAQICGEYRRELEACGANANGRPPYGWDRLPSGMALTPRMRRLYRSALVDAEQLGTPEPAGPFDEARPEDFVRWLNSPAKNGPRTLSRYLYSIYADRPDLRVAFPDIHGTHAAAFAEWIWTDGAQQENIPDDLLPIQDSDERAPDARAESGLQAGLNIAGYFRAELGIGEAARQLTSAVEAAGIPFSTTTYDATLSRQAHPFDERQARAAYDINVLCVNADSTPNFARDMGPDFFKGRYSAGYWFWEVEDFPRTMYAAFDVVDEVWTATDFIAQAVGKAGAKPVYTIPLPVVTPAYSASLDRAHLGLADAFTFVFIFDFLSVVERKNPLGVIEAFTTAFTPGEGPVLIIKSINGHLRLAELERLRAAASGRPDIRIIDGYYSGEWKNALVGAADCYVSLHRSEGLGLTMAEAMALGKPVIATAYSGNLHFMTPENSFLVDYARVNVPPGCAPYPATTAWANPDLNQAADMMREVYERPEAAAAKGRIARQDIQERHNMQTSARAIQSRVEGIRGAKHSRVTVDGRATPGAALPSPPAVGVDQLEAMLGPLNELSTLRLSAEGRWSGARLFAQRALFRVLRPLWFQQHQFHHQLVGALRLTAAAMRTEQRAREVVDTRVRELTRRVLSSRREISRLARTLDRVPSGSLPPVGGRAAGERGATTARVDDIAAAFETRTKALATGLADLQSAESQFQKNASAHLAALNDVVQKTEEELSTLSQRLYAVPYMAEPSRFIHKDAAGREQLGYDTRAGSGDGGAYVGFEDVFRGPEQLIRDRQQVYVSLLKDRARVVDLGCGRGEMLDLLREAGVTASGVDADADMVRLCQGKGHDVRQQDVLSFLREQAPQSIPALFTAQLIEHLPFPAFKELLELCKSRLSAGGVLIAETVNPHSLEAFKTFYTDLTHERPIFPEVALAWCELVGFDRADVLFPHGTGDLASDRRTQGEFAIVARVRN